MDSILGLDLSKNISFFSVPAAFVLCMIPNVYASSLAGKAYDPANPRAMVNTIASDEKVDKIRKQRIARAKNASDNGFETLGFYSAAVVAVNQAGLDARTLNVLTLGYLLSRLGYIFAYVHLGQNRNLAPLRSLFWGVSISLAITLWTKAGFKMMETYGSS